MKLSDIRVTLKEIGVSPAKSLGQNFLHDQNLARWIVDQAQITPEDYVVEIGPGLGALTRFLLERHVLDVNAPDTESGKTALGYALANGNQEIIAMLRAAGAS